MLYKKEKKIFCIGFGKTATTSLEKALLDLDVKMGNQRNAELLFNDWVKRDFKSIIKHSKTAQGFQDVPYSLPHTFIALDQYFKGSKFILTVRNNSQEWYESIVRFHAKMWGDGIKKKLDADDLKKAYYIYKGRPFETNRHIFDTREDDVYNERILKSVYENHNRTIINYFRWRPDDLLVLNLAEENAYTKMCQFLDIESNATDFPKLNVSK